MATDLAPPPFKLDVRVARSPLVALRYAVDGRATDLQDAAARLDAARQQAISRRETVLVGLKRHEETRAGLLARRDRSGMERLRQGLEAGLALTTELVQLEERIEGYRQRAEVLRSQRAHLRQLSAALHEIRHLDDASIEGPGAAENQAVRHLHHMVELDHEKAAHKILEGPMQLLAEAAMDTELIGRGAQIDPESAASALARCHEAADAALRQLHKVVCGLHPEQLRERGLIASLRQLCSDLSDVSTAQLVVLGGPRRLRAEVELAAFRVVQESVANAVAHGHAASIEVIVSFGARRLNVVVKDDGEGFDVGATEGLLGRSRGMGLITMRQRAEIERGGADVRSIVGQGTEVRAYFDDPG